MGSKRAAAKDAFLHDLCVRKGVTVKVTEDDEHGRWTPAGCREEINVGASLEPRKKLLTYVHELLHAEFPDLVENRVEYLEGVIGGRLWALGVRKGPARGKALRERLGAVAFDAVLRSGFCAHRRHHPRGRERFTLSLARLLKKAGYVGPRIKGRA